MQTLDLEPIFGNSRNHGILDQDTFDLSTPLSPIGTENNMIATVPTQSTCGSLEGNNSKQERNRYKGGATRKDLSEIPEENHWNVIRQRNAREKRQLETANITQQLTSLEERNKNLKEKAKVMEEKVGKIKGKYFNLIKNGHIKFG